MAESEPSTGLLDRVRCVVCMEQYDNNTHVPKLLPCQHTFCNSCLTNMDKASIAETQITCPVCRSKHTPRRRGFTTNRAVLDIIEEIQKQNSVKVKADRLKCAKHGNMECVLVCMDCVEGLCAKCMKRNRHQDHRLEEPSKAKSVLQRKFGKYAKERRSFLERQLSVLKKSPYSVSEITKAETDIKLFQEKLTKEITDWGDDQLSTLQDLKSDVAKHENELMRELRLLENKNADLETMIKFGHASTSDNREIVDFSGKGDKRKFEESCQTLLERIQEAFRSTDPSRKIISPEQISGKKATVDKSSQVNLDPRDTQLPGEQIAYNVRRRKGALDHKTTALEHHKSSHTFHQFVTKASIGNFSLVDLWNTLVRMILFFVKWVSITMTIGIIVGINWDIHNPNKVLLKKERGDKFVSDAVLIMMMSLISQFVGHRIMTLEESNGGRLVNMIKYGCKFYLINAGQISSVIVILQRLKPVPACLCACDLGFLFTISLFSCCIELYNRP